MPFCSNDLVCLRYTFNLKKFKNFEKRENMKKKPSQMLIRRSLKYLKFFERLIL